jgi:hypothetical protein
MLWTVPDSKVSRHDRGRQRDNKYIRQTYLLSGLTASKTRLKCKFVTRSITSIPNHFSMPSTNFLTASTVGVGPPVVAKSTLPCLSTAKTPRLVLCAEPCCIPMAPIRE